jgi:hypothetical protein
MSEPGPGFPTSYAVIFLCNNYEKSLNSDGHQFHQYQQNEQSPFVSPEHKKITAYDVGNPGPGSDMHTNVAGTFTYDLL